jgi:hypothetical protein
VLCNEIKREKRSRERRSSLAELDKLKNHKKQFIKHRNVYKENVRGLTAETTIQFTIKCDHEINSIDSDPTKKVFNPILGPPKV